MLAANLVNVFLHRVPPLLRHNQGDVLRAFDLPAPIFQFLIGVSLVLFLRKRRSLGRTPAGAGVDAVRRFILLIGLGMLLDGVGTLHLAFRWGVLQTLGLGGIVATLLAGVPGATVAALAVALLALFSGAWNGEVHSSPGAALAFVPLTLAGLLVGRALEAPDPGPACVRRSLLIAGGAAVLAVGLRTAGIPFNKLLGTSSFVALAAAVAAGGVGASAAVELTGMAFPIWLTAVGQNALTAWVLQYVLVYYPAWLIFPGWSRLAPLPGTVVILATVAMLSELAVALGRRGIRIPI
jgi:hypothetical protein